MSDPQPRLDPRLARVARVTLAEHDPAWPATFAAERDAIRHVLGDRVIAVEHIGSTAVPGVASKPIVDIAATIGSLADAPRCIELLGGIGYEYVPDLEREIPERRFLAKGWNAGQRAVHLHIYEDGDPAIERYLLFRDHLRAHPDVAAQYESLKRELAATLERPDYTDAKTPFIRDVVARARAEREPR